ncbi:hypothetical protein [Allohahella sp. A8]|uniref:hypothetical protein n=1 Tax=Allohahella sp. A8 TaxID=3141461 RepID=UPI0026BC95B1|tara:strand:- start:5984 stop:6652 length:669 start_codon:yes stop_codon:yes gene_type:complete
MHSENDPANHSARSLLAGSIQALLDAAETLPQQITQAGDLLVGSLLAEGRIITCGVHHAARSADYLAELLLYGFDKPQPSLPALSLQSETRFLASNQASVVNETEQSASDKENDFGARLVEAQADVFARQIRAFGHAHDTLVIFSQSVSSEQIRRAIHTATDQGMQIILVSDEVWLEATEGLCLVSLNTGKAHLFQEMLSLIVHGLYDRVERSLFGSGLEAG